MSDPTLALQGWIVSTLTNASPPLQVFDKVPPGNVFPRFTIGPAQCIPGGDDGQCAATWEVFQQLDAWSRENGFPEVKTIAPVAVGLLHHAEPTLTGFTVVLIEVVSTDYMRDPDGITSRARIQIRALIDEAVITSP